MVAHNPYLLNVNRLCSHKPITGTVVLILKVSCEEHSLFWPLSYIVIVTRRRDFVHSSQRPGHHRQNAATSRLQCHDHFAWKGCRALRCQAGRSKHSELLYSERVRNGELAPYMLNYSTQRATNATMYGGTLCRFKEFAVQYADLQSRRTMKVDVFIDGRMLASKSAEPGKTLSIWGSRTSKTTRSTFKFSEITLVGSSAQTPSLRPLFTYSILKMMMMRTDW